MEPPAKPLPAIVIAAGGEGRRMGGHKAGRLLGGKRLIDHAADWARRHGDATAIAIRNHFPDAPAGLPCLADERQGAGPVEALASAFRFAAERGRETVLLIGCDIPFLPDDLLSTLSAALADHGAAIPISRGRLQTMATLWRTDLLGLTRYRAEGGNSLRGYAQRVGMKEVHWPETATDPFANINTPAELAAAEKRAMDGENWRTRHDSNV